jgi:hypothetical protein
MYKFNRNSLGTNNVRISGELVFPKYPIKLFELDYNYIEDQLIKAFEPFLELKKPLSTDKNLTYYHFWPQIKILSFYVIYPNVPYSYDIFNGAIHINLQILNGDLKVKYSTSRILYSTRYTIFKEEFLKNVLNGMSRFLNSIIRDNLKNEVMKFTLPLRENTGRLLEPAEKLVAQYAGLGDIFYVAYPPKNPPR